MAQKLHKYTELLPKKMCAHADCKELGEVQPFATGKQALLTAITYYSQQCLLANKLSLQQQKVLIS